MSTGLLLGANAFSIADVTTAAVLLYFERKGWGWFLIIAALSGVSGNAALYTRQPSPAVGRSASTYTPPAAAQANVPAARQTARAMDQR